MKITKRQLKRIIAEGQSQFRHVIQISAGIFGRPMQIDEESDGNLVIVADEAEVEKHYGELMSVFPHGQMTEDGFATGMYEDMSRAPFRESITKVTKNQLRRIIREEALKFLREGEGADMIKREFREEDEIEEAHHEEGEKSENDEVKESIRRIVRETVSLEKGRDLGYGEGEGRMTKGQLSKIAREAQSLHDTLLDHDDLPEWVQSKIAVSANNISKVKDYLEYKIMRMKIDGSEQDHPVLKALLDVVDEG